MTWKQKRDWMPAEILLPIVEAWIEEHERLWPAEQSSDNRVGVEAPRFLKGDAALAGMVGVHARSIYRLRFENKQWISFELADRLLCAMDKVDLWHSHPDFKYWYNEGMDLRTNEELHGKREAMLRERQNQRLRDKRAAAAAAAA